MIIYKITNKINGKIYIGQTIGKLEKRWKTHCRSNRCLLLSRSIQKYGRDSFTIEEIDGANSLSELNYLEEHYIYMLNSLAPNGYNLMSGGSNTRHSEESKKLIGSYHKGKVISEKQKKMISERQRGNKYNIGRKWTEEEKKKISEFHKGRKIPIEAIEKTRKFHLGRKRQESSKQKMRDAHKNRAPVSAETRKRMSESQKLAHARRKN